MVLESAVGNAHSIDHSYLWTDQHRSLILVWWKETSTESISHWFASISCASIENYFGEYSKFAIWTGEIMANCFGEVLRFID